MHPPGHDDARKKKHLGWIDKETSVASPGAAVGQNDDHDDMDEDDDIVGARLRARKMSSASEDIRGLS